MLKQSKANQNESYLVERPIQARTKAEESGNPDYYTLRLFGMIDYYEYEE